VKYHNVKYHNVKYHNVKHHNVSVHHMRHRPSTWSSILDLWGSSSARGGRCTVFPQPDAPMTASRQPGCALPVTLRRMGFMFSPAEPWRRDGAGRGGGVWRRTCGAWEVEGVYGEGVKTWGAHPMPRAARESRSRQG
jgi:hypothetical protein